VLDRNPVRNGITSYEGEGSVLLWVHERLRVVDDGWVIFELDTRTFWVLKVTVGGGGGGDVILVRTTHVGVGTESEMRTVDRQRLGVERIIAGREWRVMFRPQIHVFPVMPDIGEGIATHHGRVVPVVRVRGEGSLEVVGSPGDVSPGRILTGIGVLVEVGHVRTDGVGVVELLHERTSGIWIGDLVLVLPGMVNDWVIVGIFKNAPDRLKVQRRFKVRRGGVVRHVVGRRSAGGGGVRVWSVTVEL
jgi:hypothetical protein